MADIAYGFAFSGDVSGTLPAGLEVAKSGFATAAANVSHVTLTGTKRAAPDRWEDWEKLPTPPAANVIEDYYKALVKERPELTTSKVGWVVL